MSRNNTTEDKRSMSNQTTNLKILVISGRSGSGKSSTAYEICHLLKGQKIPHAHIAGDNLDTLYPRDDSPDTMLINLKLIWTTYWTRFDTLRRQDACQRLFVVILDGTAMILNLKRIAGIFTDVVNHAYRSAKETTSIDVHVIPILLETSSEVVGHRLKAREIGGELKEHLESSHRMDQILDQAANEDVRRFVNDGASIVDLAREIIRHLGLEA